MAYASWTLFTNHAHVLFCIARDPDMRLRDVANLVGITERATQRIVSELEESGWLSHQRIGRRNHYIIREDALLRHPIEQGVSVGALLDLLETATL